MSSVTKTAYGRYILLVSDATTTATVISQLAEALDGNSIAGNKVIYFEPATNKAALAEVGR